MPSTNLYNLPDLTRRDRKALVAAGFLLTLYLWLLTHLFARQLAFHPALGQPWFASAQSLKWPALIVFAPAFLFLFYRSRYLHATFLTVVPLGLVWLGSSPIYSPLAILYWLLRFRRSASLASLTSNFFHLVMFGFVAFVVISLTARLALGPPIGKRADIHSSARWADHKDVPASGLLYTPDPRTKTMAGGNGVFLRIWRYGRRANPLDLNEDRTVLVFAPPRSGKGVGMVIPTCLGWRGSLVALDIKGEINHITAGYRARELGQIYLPFDPTRSDGVGARYSPLAEIRMGDLAVRDCQNVADILVDPDGSKTLSHWDKTAHALLTAVILHVLHSQPVKTLASLGSLLSQVGVPIRDILTQMRDTPHLGASAHPLVAETAQQMLNKADEEMSGIVSTALACLTIYQDPIIARPRLSPTSRSGTFWTRRFPFRCISLFLRLTFLEPDLSFACYSTNSAADLSREWSSMRVRPGLPATVCFFWLTSSLPWAACHFCRSRWPTWPVMGSPASLSRRTSPNSAASTVATRPLRPTAITESRSRQTCLRLLRSSHPSQAR